MASIVSSKNGHRRIQFYWTDKTRRTVHLGKCSEKDAETIKRRVESLLSSVILGTEIKADDARWLTAEGSIIRPKLAAVGLCEDDTPKDMPCVKDFLKGFLERQGPTRKPGTIAVWKQVETNLMRFLPCDIKLDAVSRGHAKQFHEHLKSRKLASLTIQKHIRIARQMFQDAVDWELIPTNPFTGIKVATSSAKSNVDVPIETVERVIAKADPTWQTIIALSRFGGLRTPSETLSLKWTDIDWEHSRISIPEPKVEHHEGRGVRSCPIFPELMPYLQDAWDRLPDKSQAEYIVDKPAYRAAANTGEGWKNANLRTQFIKLLRRAGVSPWPRLFHSMRASRQTELERKFPLHVVCAWLGNSPKIAQRSYLLVTEADFQNASAEGSETVQRRGTKTTLSEPETGIRGTKTTLQTTANDTTTTTENAGNTGKPLIFAGFPEQIQRMGRDSNSHQFPWEISIFQVRRHEKRHDRQWRSFCSKFGGQLATRLSFKHSNSCGKAPQGILSSLKRWGASAI